MARKVVLLAGLVSTIALVAALGWLGRMLTWRGPVLEPPVLVEVERGESLREVARRLEQARVVPSALVLTVLARWHGVDRRVRSGGYEFAGAATVSEVLDALARGPQRPPLVVIPEGLTVDEVAALLARAGLGKAATFSRLARDRKLARSLGVPAASLEGYLFPDTYAFERGTSPQQILSRMTRRFFEIFRPDLEAEAAHLGLTTDRAVTLASLIEKEAAIDGERPLISAVFHNRLARGMPLQSDPTVLYGVPNRAGRILATDLARSTPYNTYLIPGLPPGPIANPGRASLEAAVRPASGVKALYFVARNDRTHEFSETLEAHHRAVERYQRQDR